MFNENKFEELKKYYKFNVTQNDLYFSNKHFKVLSDLVDKGSIKRNHLYFSFAYLYLTTYLFRYTKYSDVVPSVKDIKQTLTHSSIDKKVDYLIKHNGVFDNVGLTYQLSDFPMIHEFDDMGKLKFIMLSDLDYLDSNYSLQWKKEKRINSKVTCKYNYLSFNDDISKSNVQLINTGRGTFYNSNFTTNIPFDVFLYCMSNSEIGLRGFYIYCYISFMNNINGTYFNKGIVGLSKELYMNKSSIQKYIYSLRSFNLIDTIVTDYIFNADDQSENLANSYHVNVFSSFVFNNNKLSINKPKYINADKSTLLIDNALLETLF